MVVWSPYQKLQVTPLRWRPIEGEYHIAVNGVNYMMLLDLSDRVLPRLPGPPTPTERQFSHYDIPYVFKPGAKDVLIVGAGGGNDVAGALRNGAERVVAVEIDSGIYSLGLKLHPKAPYANPKARVVINDARSFFKTARDQFDVIAFGLLDSHTLGSALTNTRIDHYVYTLESFREARTLLKPDGVLTVAFETPRPWVRERIRGMLQQAFGEEPFVFENRDLRFGWGGEMFVIGNDMEGLRARVALDEMLATFIATHAIPAGQPVRLTTDDWPYLYLESPRVPTLHLILSGLLLGLFGFIRRWLFPPSQRVNRHFFFLGAAFLLLEFQNISKTSLLFGSTWFVNALTISAILVLILLANLVVARWKAINLRWVYAGLLGSVVLLWVLPPHAFNALPFAGRAVASGILLNLPIFFAGIVFAYSFSRTRRTDVAFGSNLLGAGLGGVLESLSFLTGIRSLLLLVALLYAASWACASD